MTIQKKLNKLSKSKLVSLLENIYGHSPDIDDLIDRHIALSEPKKNSVLTLLKKQLTQLAKDQRFVPYHECPDFFEYLLTLLLDIDELLSDPGQSLSLTEDFLWLSGNICERVDDSDGGIRFLFDNAVDQWLGIASELREIEPDAENWVEKILHFFDKNDYGCFDNIIGQSSGLLTEQELLQLAWRFENEARKALQNAKDPKAYNYEAAHACIGIQSVAMALENIELFEKATLITSPEPNDLQMEQIVLYAMNIEDFQRAEYWLQQPNWDLGSNRYRHLRNQLLEAKGDREQLKTYLRDEFLSAPSEYRLQTYWEIATSAEKEEISQRVRAFSRESSDPVEIILLFLLIEDYAQAEIKMLDSHEELEGVYYVTLLEWLGQFERQGHSLLACVICYRLLLKDLLNRGYSKAYYHGARYFHKLLALDKEITDYRGLEDAKAFVREIQEKHWRKRSFWEAVDYPNKPEAESC